MTDADYTLALACRSAAIVVVRAIRSHHGAVPEDPVWRALHDGLIGVVKALNQRYEFRGPRSRRWG